MGDGSTNKPSGIGARLTKAVRSSARSLASLSVRKRSPSPQPKATADNVMGIIGKVKNSEVIVSHLEAALTSEDINPKKLKENLAALLNGKNEEGIKADGAIKTIQTLMYHSFNYNEDRNNPEPNAETPGRFFKALAQRVAMYAKPEVTQERPPLYAGVARTEPLPQQQEIATAPLPGAGGSR